MAVESMAVVPSSTSTNKSSSDLVEASNALITGFTGHAMHALALKNELLDRNNSSNGHNATSDANPLGRSTATESYTSYTNLSDGSSAYTVDPNDLKRLDDEMALFKTHFSHVKMQWIESSVKRKTLERLLDASVAEEAGLVSRDMLAEMERERDASKHGLKERKVQAESLRRDIHLVAGQLDVGGWFFRLRTVPVRLLIHRAIACSPESTARTRYRRGEVAHAQHPGHGARARHAAQLCARGGEDDC